jgi:hypothetical protein
MEGNPMAQVFLNYALDDAAQAAALCEELCARGIAVWWDQKVRSGLNWAAAVGSALDRTDAMVVLVSPRSAGSDLVRRELEQALGGPRLRNRVVLAMIEPTWVLPWRFRRLPMIDLTTDREGGLTRIVQAIQKPRRAAG